MSDLISRRGAVNEIHKYFVEEIYKTPTEIDEDGYELYTDMPTVNSLLTHNKELSKRIKSLPPAEPKTGEWTNAGVLTVRCSNCKSEFHELEAMNYCPNCGADMRGVDK